MIIIATGNSSSKKEMTSTEEETILNLNNFSADDISECNNKWCFAKTSQCKCIKVNAIDNSVSLIKSNIASSFHLCYLRLKCKGERLKVILVGEIRFSMLAIRTYLWQREKSFERKFCSFDI